MVFSSDHPEIASVSSDGRVTGLAEGEAKITAACGTFSDTLTVLVVENDETAVARVVARIEALTETSKTADIISAHWAYASLSDEQLALIEAEDQERLYTKVETLLNSRLNAALTDGTFASKRKKP